MKIEVEKEILELILDMLNPEEPPLEGFEAGYKWGLIYPTFKEWQKDLEQAFEDECPY